MTRLRGKSIITCGSCCHIEGLSRKREMLAQVESRRANITWEKYIQAFPSPRQILAKAEKRHVLQNAALLGMSVAA